MNSPYQDKYGQCNENIKMRDEMRLNDASYERLNIMWKSNELPSYISSKMEQRVDEGKWKEL